MSSDGTESGRPLLSPWDLDVEPAPPGRAEQAIDFGAKACLGASAALFIIVMLYTLALQPGGPAEEIPLGQAVRQAARAAAFWALAPFLAGCLLLQVAGSMSQKREEIARKAAWEEHRVRLSALAQGSGPPASPGAAGGGGES